MKKILISSFILAPIAFGCLSLYTNEIFGDTGSGEQLDLTSYRITFDEEFNDLSVSPFGPDTRWIAHTPWNGDFGDAKFSDPKPGFPFTIKNGVLRIEARKNSLGKWESGLLAAHNLRGNGFAQRYGYFEARAKLPAGKGVWPAFWLMGIEREQFAAELDILEFYGHDPRKLHSAYHIWSMDKKYPTTHITHVATIPNNLTDDFHTFGASIDEIWTTIYLDGRSVWKFRTPKEFNQPMFPLINLALGSGFPIDETPDPSFLEVDYIKVYERK